MWYFFRIRLIVCHNDNAMVTISYHVLIVTGNFHINVFSAGSLPQEFVYICYHQLSYELKFKNYVQVHLNIYSMHLEDNRGKICSHALLSRSLVSIIIA